MKENFKETGMNGPGLREVERTPGKQQGIKSMLVFLKRKMFFSKERIFVV